MKIGVALYSVLFSAATYQLTVAGMEEAAVVLEPMRVMVTGTTKLDSASRLPKLVASATMDQFGLESSMASCIPSAAISPALVMTRLICSLWPTSHKSIEPGLTVTTGQGTCVTNTVVKV